MQNRIDIKRLNGLFVLWFTGEHPECFVFETIEKVIVELCSPEGANWLETSTMQELRDALAEPDYWTLNTDGKPFKWRFDLDEINTAHLIVNATNKSFAGVTQFVENFDGNKLSSTHNDEPSLLSAIGLFKNAPIDVAGDKP